MNKMRSMKKRVTREAGMVAVAVVGAFALSMGTGYLSDGALNEKNQAMAQYNQTQSQLGVMRGQINKSDDAEKRYVDVKLDRDNEDYMNDTDNLKNLLKAMKDQYRFADSMKLTISADKPVDRPEFSALNYKVMLHEDMEMNVSAMSDVHVFSFLEDMKKRLPGLIRIKNFRINRKSSMSIESLTQMSSGNKPELVDATIKFTWLTLEDKNPPKPPAEGAADASNPAQPPAAGGPQ